MKFITRGSIATLLLGVALAFPTFFGASWAKDQVVAGYPTWTEGDELWARKSGTTNTKQDLTSTNSALDVNIASGSTTPPTGASATQVQGTAADGAAAVGSPVQVGGVDGSGNAQALLTDTSGRQAVIGAAADGAAAAGNPVLAAGFDGTNAQTLLTDTSGRQQMVGAVSDGGAVAGNPVRIGGKDGSGNTQDILTDAAGAVIGGGTYTNNANQPVLSTGSYGALQFTSDGALRTTGQRPATGDILDGYATVTATTGTTTLVTVSAGRTWIGNLCASVDGNKAAAAAGNGLVNATFLTTGTNVTPAAGTYWGLGTSIGANAATGTVGTQGSNANCSPIFTTTAPAGNSTTINYVTTCTNTTACAVYVSAIGNMQ